jgi:hypothetical protein
MCRRQPHRWQGSICQVAGLKMTLTDNINRYYRFVLWIGDRLEMRWPD